MTPGPTNILKCSGCAGLIAQHTIASGNTFGARFWTDGKREAPMLPDQPWLVKCPHCAALLWITELEEVGKVDWWGAGRDSFGDASTYDTPTLDDYLALAGAGVADAEKERYVRLRAWWAGNDARRTGTFRAKLAGERPGDREVPATPAETGNLSALAGLLDGSDEGDLLMKAEVMRELGRFDEARALLARVTDGGLAKAREIIGRLVEQGDRTVREMKFD